MSKFWDNIAKEHKAHLAKYGIELFRTRNGLSRYYSASDLTENEKWMIATYQELKTMGVQFIEECGVGQPFTVVHDGKNLTQDILHSSYEVHSIGRGVDFSTVTSICEIGGGSGRTAEAFARLHPHISYTICDVEPAMSVAKWYLQQVGITNVQFVSPKDIPKGKDLYLAISVLSELNPKEVASYMETIGTGKYLYLKDWEKCHNIQNNTDITRAYYGIPDSWNVIFDRGYRFYAGFFEAFYTIL
jgi:hypothetical protein